MNRPEVAERTEAFVRDTFSVAPEDPRFGRDVDLFEEGYVDSVGFTEVLAFIESEFGVEVPEEDLVSDEFASIDGMAHIVCRLTDR